MTSKSKIFIAIAVSFAAGVWLASRFQIAQIYPVAVLAIGVLGFALSFGAKNKLVTLSALLVFVCGLGALRLQSSQYPNEYQNLFDGKQQLEGYIVEDTDIRISNQFLTIRPKGFNQRILATTNLTDSYFYGDWVVVTGKLAQPKNFEDFDYQKYLERFNVYGVMSYPKIMVLKNHQQNIIKEWLLDIKWAFTKRVGRLLAEPQSSLLMGILIGARKTLPQNIVDNFNATGTSHIIAISGYNITIIISALGFLVGWLGRRKSFWLTLILILGFVILSGASASVIRAAVMGSLGLLSANIGRQYSVGPALFFAALVMLIQNPKILYWDVSFQLSFLATLGIVYFKSLLDALTEAWDDFTGIKSILLVTLCATFVTLPLILFTFGRLSIVSPLVNVLILPIVPLTMLLGFLSVLPFVGVGCAFAANFLLLYILRTTAAFAAVPNGSLSVKITEYLFAVLALAVVGIYLLLRRLVARRLRQKDMVQAGF